MSIEMRRDERDIWPEETPPGTFDISTHGLQGKDDITGHIFYVCPSGKRCGVFFADSEIAPTKPNEMHVWKWDGNIERPTLTPSINCVGGCGWHGFIKAGVMTE